MLSTALRTTLSGVLQATGRERDARALAVGDLVSLAGTLPRDSVLTIDFAAAEHLGHALVVLHAPSIPRAQRFEVLTPREREVAAYVAAGLPNREIAARLWLTTATVKDHVHHILAKTGLPNRTAVAAAWKSEEAFRQPPASATSAKLWSLPADR